ncbi:hypothetical protein P8935_06120 [Telmatobacter sp. DSM 110680]|uniref:Uncharacterized protein n=1 Tax=Telmatobacter sp. DSM 110680 TaxID=3036704 RepID=A0AAU7DNL8_9BACT
MEEWRRLTTFYGEMGDIEIRDLAAQINDLTPNAQQILRDELKKRGIADTRPTRNIPSSDSDIGVHWDDGEDSDQDIDPDALERGAAEYTWKTGLCRCDSIDEAAQRGEMLRRAGIESWAQRPGSRFFVPWLEIGEGDIQLNVAADQLDQARAVIAQPIPQDIIDELKEREAAPAYQIPRCPRCKAEDPILESVEPSNNWLCESCGHTWSDPIPDQASEN